VATLFKVSLSFLLVSVGLGVDGAMLALCATSLVLWACFYFGARRLRTAAPVKAKIEINLHDVWPVLAATIAFTLMTQLDIVLVRHYFDDHDVGIYAAAAALGKSVLYLPTAITTVLFSLVAQKHARNESSNNLLIQAASIVGLISGGAALCFLLWADWLIELFYGQAYKESARILEYFGFAMLPMALVMVAEHFLLARKQVLFVFLFVLIAPLQIVLVQHFHQRLLDVVIVSISCGSMMMISGYLALWLKRGSETHSKQSG
jgi:O-antigen/teichoic acid export membrane protein